MRFFVVFCLFLDFLWAESEVSIRVCFPEKHFIIQGDQGQKWDLKAGSGGIILNGKQSKKNSQELKAELFDLEGRQFRHVLEVQQEDGKLVLMNRLPMESYVSGVISSELPASWPLEVFKAQAIAARTYAIWQLSKKKYLETSVLDQVYNGVQREHRLSQQAAQETAGQVLTYDSKPAHAYFHASCGGHTASSQEVFGSSEPYLKGVSCSYCQKAPGFHWQYEVSRNELNKKLKSKIKGLESTKKTDSGRVQSFRFKSKPALGDMKSAEFRKILGYNQLKSTLITDYELGWIRAKFLGQGHGHGVGMCQWGALKMAKQGKKAEEILNFYYPGTEIRKLY